MSRLVRALLVLTALGAPALAQAQQQGYAINQLDLSERGSEWFANDSLDLRGHLRPAIGLVGEWAYRPLVAKDGSGDYRRAVVRDQFVLHPGASLVLFDRLRLAIDVPVQAYASGRGITLNGTAVAPPANATSLGDIRLGAALRLFGVHGEAITGALSVQVALPTGDEDSYASDGSTRITPTFAIAGDVSWFTYAAGLGVTIRTVDASFEQTQLGPLLNFTAAAGVRALDRRLVIGPEFFLHSTLTDGQFFKRRTTTMEGLIGTHYMVVDGLRIGGGIGTGLTSGYGAPDLRGLLMVEWAPTYHQAQAEPADRDHDGVLDEDDACPDQPGKPSDDADKNGCPVPEDRDHDGILDNDDACPDQAGVRSDDAAKNGCPAPLDRDHDGIVDNDDACPDEPGDAAKNGCPAPLDRDHDGIPDSEDACPDQAGERSSDPQRNGCPKPVIEPVTQINHLGQVKFKTNSSEILPGRDSEEVLEAVIQTMKDHPEISRLRVEGHTDNTGGADLNRRLSKSRAASVARWLSQHGIAPKRLDSEGYGPDRPIADNDTEEGKRNNRRVEFHIAGSP